ncbi:ExbD/TolR family protein [Salisaeta longa]|uniref:ExbD/TolR family protein n=1 Tax=Salisaeta longa TaxID=503170 RepID=UPI0003B4C17C|nr:biopolymer transporter ExbD [Salisaeta longa]
MAGFFKDDNKQRRDAEIPSGSMADIAFLLLIFFLVTTTINVDTGIGMTLPPKLEQNQEPPPVKERNMLKVLVNAEGQVLIEEEPASVAQIRGEVRRHVLNYGKQPDYAVSPSDAVISIKTDAKTTYQTYIKVLDEVWMAYREIWGQVARTGQLPNGETVLQKTYPSYQEYRASLEPGEENVIRESIGANISIAEPDLGN